MITEDRFGLRPIWDELLKIYKEIAQICDKHGLRYYATDGTALGAIRHKGYIPWDDDFDISMPRLDYEKFIRIAEQELPPHLKFVNWKNTPEIHILFGKVQETRQDKVEALEKKSGYVLSNGIFVDVFPIDGYPKDKFSILRIKLEDFVLKHILWFRFGCSNSRLPKWKKILKTGFGCLFSFLMPQLRTYQDVLARYERMCVRHNFDKCDYTGRTCSDLTVLRRAPLQKLTWGQTIDFEFHDTTVKIPEDYDAHLRNEYFKWDYMQYPPKDAQHPTHTLAGRFPWWLGPTTNRKPY